MVEQPAVGLRLRMVEFVDHHDIEAVRLDSVQPIFRQGLNTGEHVAPLLRLVAVN